MEFINNLPDSVKNIFASIVTLIIALIVYRIARIPLKRMLGANKENKERSTYINIVGSILKYIYLIIIVLCILQINGVDVSAMLAGVGIISAIAGLAIQDTLKDIIRGISIISDEYFRVGDYVTIGDTSGTVVKLGIKSTKVRDTLTGNITSIANRNIEQAQVGGATIINLDIPLPYELKLSRAEEVMNEIIAEVTKLEMVESAEYRGVNDFGESAVQYHIYAVSTKGQRIAAKRAIYRTALAVMEKHRISVPYPQLDIHQK